MVWECIIHLEFILDVKKMDYSKYLQFWTKGILGKKKIITDKKESVYGIDFESLKKDVDLVIFDFDDTLVDFKGQLDSDMSDFLDVLIQKGYKIGVFSNCSEQRSEELHGILDPLGIYSVQRSDKPSPAGFVEVMEHYQISPDKTIAVGDKLGTEMYGAYLAGIKYRILVEPFSSVFGGKRASVFHRIVRKVEKLSYSQIS